MKSKEWEEYKAWERLIMIKNIILGIADDIVEEDMENKAHLWKQWELEKRREGRNAKLPSNIVSRNSKGNAWDTEDSNKKYEQYQNTDENLESPSPKSRADDESPWKVDTPSQTDHHSEEELAPESKKPSGRASKRSSSWGSVLPVLTTIVHQVKDSVKTSS